LNRSTNRDWLHFLTRNHSLQKPDNFTFSFILKIIVWLGLVLKLILMSGILSCIEIAHQLVEEMREPELVAWNSIMDCHDLFTRMVCNCNWMMLLWKNVVFVECHAWFLGLLPMVTEKSLWNFDKINKMTITSIIFVSKQSLGFSFLQVWQHIMNMFEMMVDLSAHFLLLCRSIVIVIFFLK